jgi:2,4-dienoyl-CoA reductase-like NADH-dependent reductase (Old Yellow Enzyme family)
MAEYYARRARNEVGLILTESTAISPVGDGFPNAPRVFAPEHIAGWRTVTTAVHAGGAPIFCQLIHCGRITHPDYTDGRQPVSATDRRAAGINRRNGQPYPVPRRLRDGELPAVIDEFRLAAAAAIEAGFDGVELHLAHGYLVDQFLDARVNDRSGAYGGSIPNRCRFAIELTAAVVGDLGPARVMARISPSRWMDGLYEWPDLPGMLAYLLPSFDAIGLRMLDISCARAVYHDTAGRAVRLTRARWPHLLIAGASLSPLEAQAELDQGLLDMVTYGRALIANPDLVPRLRTRRELRAYDPQMLQHLD